MRDRYFGHVDVGGMLRVAPRRFSERYDFARRQVWSSARSFSAIKYSTAHLPALLRCFLAPWDTLTSLPDEIGRINRGAEIEWVNKLNCISLPPPSACPPPWKTFRGKRALNLKKNGESNDESWARDIAFRGWCRRGEKIYRDYFDLWVFFLFWKF